jgi:hypothetical protein
MRLRPAITAITHSTMTFFRAHGDDEGISEVLRAGKWVPYRGDALEPIALGRPISGAEVPGRAGKLAGLLEARDKFSRQIEILESGRRVAPRRQMIRELKQMLSGIEQQLAELQPDAESATGSTSRLPKLD